MRYPQCNADERLPPQQSPHLSNKALEMTGGERGARKAAGQACAAGRPPHRWAVADVLPFAEQEVDRP